MARKYGRVASRITQRAVQSLIREHGLRSAAALLGVTVDVTSRIAAGAAVIQANLAVAEARLKTTSPDAAV
jgi:hypothetical protein